MSQFDSREMLVLWGFCRNKLKVIEFWFCCCCYWVFFNELTEMVAFWSDVAVLAPWRWWCQEVSDWINWKWLCSDVAGRSALTLWRSLKNCSWTPMYRTLAPLIPLVLIRWVHRHPYPIGLYPVCTRTHTHIHTHTRTRTHTFIVLDPVSTWEPLSH